MEPGIEIAWNFNGNGDVIIDNVSNAINNLLGSIDKVIKSEEFQNWLNNCSDRFRKISDKINNIDWQPLIDCMVEIGTNIGTIALEILDGVIAIFKWLVENPTISEVILAIAAAIIILEGALKLWNIAQAILDTTIWKSPITWIIAGIISLIAILVLCIFHFERIKEAVISLWENIKQFLMNLWNNVEPTFKAIWNVVSTVLGIIGNLFMTVFQAIWNVVSTILNDIWQIISTIFEAIYNVISSILGSIFNIFSQIFNWILELSIVIFQKIRNAIEPVIIAIWDNIKNVLEKIQAIWSNIWGTIANVVINIWNDIWKEIKSVINLILGGIEKFINGAIKGINFLLSGINSIANAIGSLIGISPISLKMNLVSIPRLAKGNVAYSPMIAQFGEYIGARTNPEITTPQNIMRETFDEVLANHEWNNNVNGSPLQLSVYVGNKKLGDILLDNLRDIRRQTGNNLEALVGG